MNMKKSGLDEVVLFFYFFCSVSFESLYNKIVKAK